MADYPADLVRERRLDDGRTLWRVSFPDNLWSSAAVGHLLIGWGRDGRLVVLG